MNKDKDKEIDKNTDVNKVKNKVGRPKKKEYDETKLFIELMNGVDYCFERTGEIKATADELGISVTKVKKLLITSGKLEYDETRQIQRLLAYGKSISDIQKETGLKKSSINSYLPYTKVPYKAEEISCNAERCELYRKRRVAVEEIKDIETLWNCLVLFEGYPFRNQAGHKFSYELKKEKAGDIIKEIIIDSSGEGIPFSTIVKTYEKVGSKDMVNCLETLGEFCGADYLYSIFNRFGII